MAGSETQDPRTYAQKLRSYTVEELEDVYFHMDVLQNPARYYMILRELEARRLREEQPRRRGTSPDIDRWLARVRWLAARPTGRAVAKAVLLFAVTAVATAAMLLPAWLLAVPFRFDGIQASIVYIACAPIPPVVGAMLGVRMGGRGLYRVPVLLGVMAAIAVFSRTAAPGAILQPLVEPQGGGGITGFGGF